MSKPDEEITDREKMIHNEKIKAAVAFYNGVTIALIAVLGFGGLIRADMPAEATFSDFRSAFGPFGVAFLGGWLMHIFLVRGWWLEKLK